MRDVSRRLAAAVEQAERVIQERAATENGDVATDAELGLYELGKRMEDGGTVLVRLANEVATNMVEFTRHVNVARSRGVASGGARTVAASLARDVAGPAREVQRLGGEMEAAMSAVDADLRQFHSLVMRFGTAAMKEAARRDVAGFEERFGGLRETMAIMVDFIAKVQPLEMLSAPLRQAIRPLRDGVGAIHVAMSVMESWTVLAVPASVS